MPEILTLDLTSKEKVKALVNAGQVPDKNVTEAIVIECYKDDKAKEKPLLLVVTARCGINTIRRLTQVLLF